MAVKFEGSIHRWIGLSTVPRQQWRTINVVSLRLGYVSGNNAPTSLAWNHTKNTGAQAATGASSPILTFTEASKDNCLLGGPDDSHAKRSPTTNTFTAAPVFGRPVGLSLFTGVAATATIPFPMQEQYDGDLSLAPGTAISLVTQAATTTALFRETVVWEEIDL